MSQFGVIRLTDIRCWSWRTTPLMGWPRLSSLRILTVHIGWLTNWRPAPLGLVSSDTVTLNVWNVPWVFGYCRLIAWTWWMGMCHLEDSNDQESANTPLQTTRMSRQSMWTSGCRWIERKAKLRLKRKTFFSAYMWFCAQYSYCNLPCFSSAIPKSPMRCRNVS